MAVRGAFRTAPRTPGVVGTVPLGHGISLPAQGLQYNPTLLGAAPSLTALGAISLTPAAVSQNAAAPRIQNAAAASPAQKTPPSLRKLLRQKKTFSLKTKEAASMTGGQAHFAGRKMFNRLLGIELAERGGASIPTAGLIQGRESGLLARAPRSDSEEPSFRPPSPRAGKTTPKGKLVIMGGGPMVSAILKKALELAGGSAVRVLVIPQASRLAEVGKEVLEMWRAAGAAAGEVLDLSDREAALEQVRKADFIWMSGGDQRRLMRALKGTGVPEAIEKRLEEGGVVGGTSAGAAVMSDIMITGGSEKGPIPGAKGVKTGKGLGLWPGVIVDQHFIRRRRFFRLLSAVLSLPKLLGIGIDESTAVVLQDKKLEVVGDGSVVVIDGRGRSGTDVDVKILKPGSRLDLE